MSIKDTITKLKSAIEHSDWTLVCDVYEDLAGEKINCPEQEEDDFGKRLISAMTELINTTKRSNKTKPAQTIVEKPKKKTGRPRKTNTSISPRNEKTIFGDDSLLIEDSKNFKGTDKNYRDEYKPVKTECFRCRKVYEVHPSLIPRKQAGDDTERTFVCNSCIGPSRID